MKKVVVLVAFIAITLSSFAQSVTGIVSSKGIAPAPAFNYPHPAAMVLVNAPLGKNFEFDPDYAFDARNGKLWFADTWLRLNLPMDTAKRFIATLGYNWSLFGQNIQVNNEPLTQVVHYPTYELKFRFLQSKKNTFTFDWWYTYPIEKAYGVTGSYVSIQYSRSEESKYFTFTTDPNVFYIHYTDGTDGLAASLDAVVAHKKTGLFASVQAMTPINATNTKFVWNVSLGISVPIH